MRDSFLLYTEYQEQIELLDMEQRGALFTAILEYAAGTDPDLSDGMVRMAFSFIKAKMDKDTQKYEQICEERRKSGSKGGRPTKANGFSENQTKAKKANGFSEKQTKAKKPDNDNEYDNDNDLNNKKHILSGTISHIVDHLNEKAGTNFRDQSKSTRQHIHARLDEGFTEADFYTVIDKKVEEWKGTDMAKYLRPETLFGSKFEGYLNQTRAAPAKVSNFTPRDQNLDDEVYRLGLFANL